MNHEACHPKLTLCVAGSVSNRVASDEQVIECSMSYECVEHAKQHDYR